MHATIKSSLRMIIVSFDERVLNNRPVAGELAWQPQFVPIEIRDRRSKRWRIILDFGAVHPAAIVIVVVEPILVPIHELMRIQRLVRVERMADGPRYGDRRNVHLSVGLVAISLGIEIVEQVRPVILSRLAIATEVMFAFAAKEIAKRAIE